jgi:hypothetical protein
MLSAGHQARREAAAERSNCLDCQGLPRMLSDSDLLGLPGGVVFHHGVQDRQELTHGSCQCNFGRLARGPQPLVEGLEHRVVSDRDERTHV